MAKKSKKAALDSITQSEGAAVLDDDGFETLGGEAGQEMAVGEVVEGKFQGVTRTLPGRKKGTTIPFYTVGNRSILGGTVLRTRIEEALAAGKLKVGDLMRVTRLEDAKKKPGQNPAKIYRVQVKR